MARNIFHGFIPINLPIIDPTSPPEPWKGTITNNIIPINLRGFIQLYLFEVFLPIFSILSMNFPINGIFFARS